MKQEMDDLKEALKETWFYHAIVSIVEWMNNLFKRIFDEH